jgi:hypothetical protein
MNMKKGSNSFVLSFSVLICGAIFTAADMINPYLEKSHSTFLRYVHIFTSQFGDTGKMILAAGGIWLIFSFVGSFFSFKTDNLMMKVFGAIMVMMLLCAGYIIFLIVSGISILQHPWTVNVLMGLVGTFFLIISSTVFLHAARTPEEEPDAAAKMLEKLLDSGKVVFLQPRNPRDH